MATFAATDFLVTVNSVDLSAWVKSVDLDIDAEDLDDTNMGDTTKISLAGLNVWGGRIGFSQDFAAGGPDATLNGIVGTVVTVAIQPTSAAKATTNPSYEGSALIKRYKPFGNSAGEKATCEMEFVSAGDITRDVTP